MRSFTEIWIDAKFKETQLADYRIGLSVAPYVYYKGRPTGPHAEAVVRPLASLPKSPTDPTL